MTALYNSDIGTDRLTAYDIVRIIENAEDFEQIFFVNCGERVTYLNAYRGKKGSLRNHTKGAIEIRNIARVEPTGSYGVTFYDAHGDIIGTWYTPECYTDATNGYMRHDEDGTLEWIGDDDMADELIEDYTADELDVDVDEYINEQCGIIDVYASTSGKYSYTPAELIRRAYPDDYDMIGTGAIHDAVRDTWSGCDLMNGPMCLSGIVFYWDADTMTLYTPGYRICGLDDSIMDVIE